MVRLKYNLDEIKLSPFVPDRCRAELKSVTKTWSRVGNPMLRFEWLIQSGPNKGKKISSYALITEGSAALDSFHMHLKALGIPRRPGMKERGGGQLAGRLATLVLTESPSTKPGRNEPFVGVSRVLPYRRGSGIND